MKKMVSNKMKNLLVVLLVFGSFSVLASVDAKARRCKIVLESDNPFSAYNYAYSGIEKRYGLKLVATTEVLQNVQVEYDYAIVTRDVRRSRNSVEYVTVIDRSGNTLFRTRAVSYSPGTQNSNDGDIRYYAHKRALRFTSLDCKLNSI